MATQKSSQLSVISHVLDTWNIIAEKYKKLFVSTAVGTSVSFLAYTLLLLLAQEQFNTMAENNGSPASFTFVIIMTIAVTLLVAGVQIFFSVVNVQILAQKKETTWVQLIYNSMERFWPTVLLAFVVSLVLGLITVITELIATILDIGTAFLSQSFFNAGGFSFILILSSIFLLFASLFFMYTPFLVIIEETTLLDAVRANIALLRGRFFRTLWHTIILYFAILGLTLILQFIPYIGSFITLLLAPVILLAYIFTMYTKLKNQN